MLFDVKPAVKVQLNVEDFDGKPTVGRFTFTDAAGHVFPPQAKRLAPDLFFQKQIYRPDGGHRAPSARRVHGRVRPRAGIPRQERRR